MQLAGWSMIEASFPLCSISYGALILLLMLLLRFLDIFSLGTLRRRQIPYSTVTGCLYIRRFPCAHSSTVST
ncbi:hypothetical protein F5B19DRAFT_444381 [Rostrohypoxylon terebratum]|nr:hypothetical protein F5B19DRAFT_444381 [Rostrohypoxylon terebratum]